MTRTRMKVMLFILLFSPHTVICPLGGLAFLLHYKSIWCRMLSGLGGGVLVVVESVKRGGGWFLCQPADWVSYNTITQLDGLTTEAGDIKGKGAQKEIQNMKSFTNQPISHLREYAKWNMSYTCHHCQYSVTLLMCRGRCYDLWGYLYPSLGMFISGFLPIMLMPNPSEAFSSLHTHT